MALGLGVAGFTCTPSNIAHSRGAPPCSPGRNHVSDTIYLDFSAVQTDALVFSMAICVSECHKRLTLGNGNSRGCAGSEPIPGAQGSRAGLPPG